MKTINDKTVSQIRKILEIFDAKNGEIRPHFILTGPSGSGKSYNIQLLINSMGNHINFFEINAAQLTKEGTSGNSLSKALTPLKTAEGLTVCFVDEFDKLFISGNTNSHVAHETTNGVQNEFLKILESDTTAVYDDYGKYVDVDVKNTLFIFAGAFNGEANIDIDRLRDFGIKTEFLGRVGLVYNMQKLSMQDLKEILESSKLLTDYLEIFPEVKRSAVVSEVMAVLEENYEKNTLGARMINTLIHKYFVEGGSLRKPSTKASVFKRTLNI